jgi:Flp pilus assembly protein TadD
MRNLFSEIKGLLESQAKRRHGDRSAARQLNDRGLGLFQDSQYVEAARLFREAHKADPADIEVHNNLGYALLMAGDLGEAEKVLTDVLTVAPGRGAAWGNLGNLCKSPRSDR